MIRLTVPVLRDRHGFRARIGGHDVAKRKERVAGVFPRILKSLEF
jgi:hypothetical protein